MKHFTITPSQLTRFGYGLSRPECVLCTAQGDVLTSHFGGGVSRINNNGQAEHFLGPGEPVVATNGFALTRQGEFLCANLLPPGGVWKITQDGRQEPYLLEIDGYVIPSVNFVYVDSYDGHDRVWMAVSTRREPRSLGYRPDVDDGFIVLKDQHGERIVAAGLGYTNEAKIDPSGQWLYVNETFGRRTSRFRVSADGQLGQRQTVAEYGHGTFPDGLDFDSEGGVWLTSVLSNRVIRIAADGSQQLILQDYDSAWLDEVETAFQAGKLGRSQMDNVNAQLKSISSVTFGGPDLKTVYLGNLLDDCLYTFQSPIAGAPPSHWHFKL